MIEIVGFGSYRNVSIVDKLIHIKKIIIVKQIMQKKKKPKSSTFTTANEIKWYYRKHAYTLYHFSSFLNLTISDRIKRIIKLNHFKYI